MRKLSKGDKVVLKYLAAWLCLKIFQISEVIGFIGIIGTAGALEQNSITYRQALIQTAIIIASMVFIGVLTYVIENIIPHIRRKTAKIIRKEQTEKQRCFENSTRQASA